MTTVNMCQASKSLHSLHHALWGVTTEAKFMTITAGVHARNPHDFSVSDQAGPHSVGVTGLFAKSMEKSSDVCLQELC